MNGSLAGTIRSHGGNPIPGDHRSNHDDRAGFVAAHMGEERAGGIQRAEDIRVELVVPRVMA